ncbi:MAG: hypothetical protein GX676_04505 [Bacilli bacterium]|nr:hypothetical protein [Bacilli bacterium]
MLYWKYVKILFKSQLEYRTSFILLSIGQIFVPFSVFLGMYFLFQRFNEIKGFTLWEVALCYGIIHIAFSLSECFARGFDNFSRLVVTGDFDRILVRPRSTIVQVLGSQFEFTRIGRLFQAVVIFIIALTKVQIDWNIIKILTFILMIISGIFIFAGIYMIGATLCFFTIEGLEVINILTDGGREISQYPINIYKDWVKKLFTFVIPYGVVNYLPLLYVLGKNNQVIYAFTPLLGILFIIPCILIWNYGVKHYLSTGS